MERPLDPDVRREEHDGLESSREEVREDPGLQGGGQLGDVVLKQEVFAIRQPERRHGHDRELVAEQIRFPRVAGDHDTGTVGLGVVRGRGPQECPREVQAARGGDGDDAGSHGVWNQPRSPARCDHPGSATPRSGITATTASAAAADTGIKIFGAIRFTRPATPADDPRSIEDAGQ